MKAKVLIIILLLLLIMTGIVHERVVASRDKGLATDWNADHEITGNVDQDQNQFLNAVIEQRTDWPAGPIEGQKVWRSDLNNLYIFDGSNWISHTPGIIKGTHYWNCPGSNFKAWEPDVQDVEYNAGADNSIIVGADGINLVAPVSLPHGAVVTAVVVYGNIVDESWGLMRAPVTGGVGALMANAALNTEDATITNPTIDNNAWSYWFYTTSLDTGDGVYGARITYTL